MAERKRSGGALSDFRFPKEEVLRATESCSRFGNMLLIVG